jgi:hypothetical protein
MDTLPLRSGSSFGGRGGGLVVTVLEDGYVGSFQG